MTGASHEKKKSGMDFLSCLLALLIIIVAVVSVNCYIEKYEKDYKYNKLQSELTDVKNDYALLQIDYQKRTSYSVVENYAENHLAMTKLSSYQKLYLTRDVQDCMCTVDTGSKATFADRVSKVFSVVLEYFR